MEEGRLPKGVLEEGEGKEADPNLPGRRGLEE
jgi:hypothetical protein